jgi:hypothetical protein
MPTKHRKDVDRVDLHIACRFKAHLLKKIFRDMIQPHEVGCSFVQLWEQRDKIWIASIGGRTIDTKGTQAIDLQVFHWVTRQIKKELAVPERQVVHVLRKMSLLRYPKKNGGWKTEDIPPRILLEHYRIFGLGTIKKRRPSAPGALIEKSRERVTARVMEGWSEAEARLAERCCGLDDLERLVEEEATKKQERFAKIKTQIIALKQQ